MAKEKNRMNNPYYGLNGLIPAIQKSHLPLFSKIYFIFYILCLRNVNEILGSLIFFWMGISCVYNFWKSPPICNIVQCVVDSSHIIFFVSFSIIIEFDSNDIKYIKELSADEYEIKIDYLQDKEITEEIVEELSEKKMWMKIYKELFQVIWVIMIG